MDTALVCLFIALTCAGPFMVCWELGRPVKPPNP